MLAGKVWGETVAFELNAFMSGHHASIKAGKQCSKHLHKSRWNGFYVVSGKLEVHVWQPEGLVDITTLGPRGYTKVPPGIKHRFVCIEDCELIEIYWPQFDHSDIVRDDTGGATPHVA